MKKLLSACLFSLPLLMTTQVVADDAASLKQRLEAMTSLHADFSQRVTDVNSKVIQNGSGVFALSYPNQFYWHLTAPDESLIVADGKDVWIYNPFAEEVTVMDVAQAINASPIALLVYRDEATWAQYLISKEADCYNIAPKSVDSGLVGVQVCFKEMALTHFVLEDDQGNISQFTLSKQRKLTSVESTIFEFDVPANVDIDDQRQQSTQ